MPRSLILHVSWPVIAMSVLLMSACFASIVSISRLQSELGDSFRTDSAMLQAAQQVQIHLREYRSHSIVYMAGPLPRRLQQLQEDRHQFLTSLESLRQLSDDPEEIADLHEIETLWNQYEEDLGKDTSRKIHFGTIEEFAAWTDTHRINSMLVPCNRIVERSERQMAETVFRSAKQSKWAGVLLLMVGVIGPTAGLVGGYTIARKLSLRMMNLSVRIQAVQSHLDQDVGAMIVDHAATLGEIDSQLDRVVERVRDVCQKLQEQERNLLRAEQLAAVGQLAAGVAHEVRNPLTGIKMLVESAIRPANPTLLTADDLVLIRDEISRLERTVQGLLDFAKPTVNSRQLIDVRDVINKAIAIHTSRANQNHLTVQFHHHEMAMKVAADRDQMISLFSNLILNAIEASPQHGTIEIECSKTQMHALAIQIDDQGPGINDSLKNQLFTPFATTKPNGTGLGLAIARRIALDYGGTITAQNRPNGGARFIVTIPEWEADRA